MDREPATETESRWAEIAYEAIAPVYDDFTAHHDYELWLGALLPKAERHGLGGRPAARRRLRDRQELHPDARARLAGAAAATSPRR